MTEKNQDPDNVEMAKKFGQAALHSGADVLLGKKKTSALKWAVIGFRILGFSIFLMAISEYWLFEGIALMFGWLKSSLIGLVIGFMIFCFGEIINVLINIESHLRKLADSKTS